MISLRTGEFTSDVSVIDVYPNPAVESFSLTFNGEISDDMFEMNIYDSAGRLVRTMNLESGLLENGKSTQIDISDIDQGVYNVKISHGKFSWAKKLVILE